MSKKSAGEGATKRRVTSLSLGGALYETNDLRVGDRVTFEGAWRGKPVGNRKFKIIDIDRVVIADAEGQTAVVGASSLKIVPD